jgi:Flp pilus assembly protein TadG
MLLRVAAERKRKGTVVVETALIIFPLLMFVFGVFEYGRFLMELNLVTNAAREGCRYALANNTSSTVTSSVQSLVTQFMGGQTTCFSSFTVTVSGTHAGVSTPVNNLAAGDSISVAVSGTYKFLNIVPLVKMPTSYTMTSTVTMICEGGT